MIFLYWRDFKV